MTILRLVLFSEVSTPPPELQLRSTESPKSGCTTHYLLMLAAEAVGFLSLDRTEHELGIYEIWIRSDKRRQGLARHCLCLIEELAASESRTGLWVRPVPLSPDTAADELVNLYVNTGYRPDRADPELWRKWLQV